MLALTRAISDSFVSALAAVPPDPPIDLARARAQHAAYRAALTALGAQVRVLAADAAYPDGCFVEDTAVIAAGVALLTRSAAPSRRGEGTAVAQALGPYVELATMAAPATLDGGDCLLLGRTLYVGRSARTNPAGIARAAEVFGPRGLRVIAVDLPRDVLHLKCVCARLDDDRVLVAEGALPADAFGGAAVVWVPRAEAYAANVVTIGASAIIADGFPATRAAVAGAGFAVHPVATSELRKADGSLTCLSLLLQDVA